QPSSIYRYYGLFFWPPFVLKNLADLVKMLVMGKTAASSEEKEKEKNSGLAMFGLAVAYLISLRLVLWQLEIHGSTWMQVLLPLVFHGLAVFGGIALLPRRFFESKSAGSLNYDRKVAAALRMTVVASILVTFSWSRAFLGFNPGRFYVFFWILPLLYVFPYLMLLREVYQHANLGTGKLDNSRIIYADAFTRWALLPYGNDFHLIHHLYPNIPHYSLKDVHQELIATSESYRASLDEVHGTLKAPEGERSLAQALSQSREERSAA
ncbi:MAG: fatty acid desaturase, partial [Verrucomicrobiota bacterium]